MPLEEIGLFQIAHAYALFDQPPDSDGPSIPPDYPPPLHPYHHNHYN